MCVFAGILEKCYYIIHGPAKLHCMSYPQVLERQGEHELPKIKVFPLLLPPIPQCLMHSLEGSRPWVSIYGTQMEKLPGRRGGS